MADASGSDPAVGPANEGESGRDEDASLDTEAEGTADDAPPDPLLVWALAGFHVGLLVAVAVTVLHAVDALGDLLGGLGTATGLWLYAALWGLTWYTNRQFLRRGSLSLTRRSLLTAAMLGGATGVGFLLVLALTIGAFTLNPIVAVFLALVGTPVAVFLGAVVGLVEFGVDLTVIAVARGLVETR